MKKKRGGKKKKKKKKVKWGWGEKKMKRYWGLKIQNIMLFCKKTLVEEFWGLIRGMWGPFICHLSVS